MGLLTTLRCRTCKYRNQCHAELAEVELMQIKIKALMRENNEYEKELQVLIDEINRLKNEIENTNRKYDTCVGKE